MEECRVVISFFNRHPEPANWSNIFLINSVELYWLVNRYQGSSCDTTVYQSSSFILCWVEIFPIPSILEHYALQFLVWFISTEVLRVFLLALLPASFCATCLEASSKKMGLHLSVHVLAVKTCTALQLCPSADFRGTLSAEDSLLISAEALTTHVFAGNIVNSLISLQIWS